MSASTATVIVTWNQARLALDALESAAGAGAPLDRAVVVDNASQPPAAALVRSRFPQVRTIRMERNTGFAAGQNAGIRAALGDGAGRVLLLNDDALLEPGALAALEAALEADPRVAAASPKVYYHGSERVIQSVGLRVVPERALAQMLGSGERDRGQHDHPADRDALFGCVMLVRRAAWEQVGEFWEPFFNYAEETDWCLRARRAGWRLRYVPAAAWHRASSSLGPGAPLKQYLITRNMQYLRRRNTVPGARVRRGLALAALADARTVARFARLRQPQHARAVLLGWWDFWRGRAGDCRAPDLGLRR